METILRRQQHRDQQAMALLRAAVQQAHHDAQGAAGTHHPQQPPQPRSSKKKTTSDLKPHAIRTLAADPDWRARLLNLGDGAPPPSWADVLAFLTAPARAAAVRLSKWEAQSFAASMHRIVEEEEKAGLRASFDHGQVVIELAPARRRSRRGGGDGGSASQQQHLQQPREEQQQEDEEEEQQQQQDLHLQEEQQQIPVPTMDLTAIPSVVFAKMFDFLSLRERDRCSETAPGVRDAVFVSELFQNIIIRDNRRQAGPGLVAALVRRSLAGSERGRGGSARRLEVGLNAGRFPDDVVDITNLTSALVKERTAVHRLCNLFVNDGAGKELQELIFHDMPAWLKPESLCLLLQHTPSLTTYKGPLVPQIREVFDSGCLPHLRRVEFDIESSLQYWPQVHDKTLHTIWTETCAQLPSLRHVVVVGKRGPTYYPYAPVHSPTIVTLEIYRMGFIKYYYPPAGNSHTLQHLRLQFHREQDCEAENGLYQWHYPLLSVLHLRFRQGYCGAKYPAPLITALCSGCCALEWVFLDLYPRIPDDSDDPLVALDVSRDQPLDPSPLLRLPRLFYLLLRPANWDLSRLPQGWIMQEINSGNDALMLEPQVFSRPSGASNGLVACFKPAASPVSYGRDNEHWRWRRPQFFTLEEMRSRYSGNETIWY